MERLFRLIIVTITLGLISGCSLPVPALSAPEMVSVPAGDFTMGTNLGFAWERPIHTIYLDAYRIDPFELTNAQYRRCVDAGKCRSPDKAASHFRNPYYGNSQYDNYPVIYVSWYDADVYCRWATKRLPSEAEWEKAARGTDARQWPWGNTWDLQKISASTGAGDTTAVGSHPGDMSPYGGMDMAGNVTEWVADWYDSGYYADSPRDNPTGPSAGIVKVTRGGSWNSGYAFPTLFSTVHRFFARPDYADDALGFRCAQ